MDAFVRRYIHENLCYRFVILPDGAAASEAEETIKGGGWEYGCPSPETREGNGGGFLFPVPPMTSSEGFGTRDLKEAKALLDELCA